MCCQQCGATQWVETPPLSPGWAIARRNLKAKDSSPLDDIITTSWPTQWSRQFHELLVTLTHLVQLEDEQKQLLETIIAGEQLTKDELASLGVQWPTENKDRKPHFPGELF